MAEIASWNGHSFTVSPNLIRSFTGLTIKGSSETEDKTGDGQKYVSRKNSNPSEISLTAELNALTGCDVKNEALKFVEEARKGAKDYFYMGGKKLITCQLMLTEASVSETAISANGTWVKCKVNLTMKQCEKYDGTGSGSKKSSTKTTSTTTVQKVAATAAVVGAVAAAAGKAVISASTSSVKNTVISSAVSSIASKAASAIKSAVNAVNNAKSTSSTTKKTSTSTKVSAGKNIVKAVMK